MDTSDPEIVFDAGGVCNHCHAVERIKRTSWFPNSEGARRLDELVAQIRAAGAGKDYDCLMGLSGGIDSSYLAYFAVRHLGLRPVAVHVDAGWNSEIAVRNIENVVKALNLDLYTFVVDWEEMRDLQLAFLRAGTPNQDIPQDHAFAAHLYRFAAQQGIKYMLRGGNYASESILPRAWGYNNMDLRHISGIHKRYGQLKLRNYPRLGFFRYNFLYPYVQRISGLNPLNYTDYNPREAMTTLTREVGWQYYGGKHFESRFTKYFQGHYLPARYGYDKRRAHYSSLIAAGQMTRDEALTDLRNPVYRPEELRADEEYVIKKLGISRPEFESLVNQPPRTAADFPSNAHLLNAMAVGVRWKRRLTDLKGRGAA